MKTSDRVATWIETQYCASVAATLQARAEFFELLEDAMVSPVRLVRALTAWRKHESQTAVLGQPMTFRLQSRRHQDALFAPFLPC